MDKVVKIQLDIPEKFSIQLDRYLIDLKEKGVKTSKADEIIRLAQIGFKYEIK